MGGRPPGQAELGDGGSQRAQRVHARVIALVDVEIEADPELGGDFRRGPGGGHRISGPVRGPSDRHRAAVDTFPNPGGDLRIVEVGVDRHGDLAHVDAGYRGGRFLHRLPRPEPEPAADRGVRADMADAGVVEQAEGPAASRCQRLDGHPVDRAVKELDGLVQ